MLLTMTYLCVNIMYNGRLKEEFVMIRKTKLFKHISYVLLITILITNISSCISIDFFGNLNNDFPAGDLPPLKTEIVRAYEELKTSLNVKSYNIPYHKDQPVDVLKEIMEEILVDRPDLFYIEPIFIYTSESKDGGKSYVVSDITFKYKYKANEIQSKKDDFEKRINDIVDNIPFINEVEDKYKVILIHDYLVLNFDYDHTLKSSDAYTILTTGKGTCQAYYGLMKCILDKIGIESSYVKSYILNHIWNSVKIDEKWYMVDCTWDDIEKVGVMLHTRCLISESKSKAMLDDALAKYEIWDSPYVCSDTLYDNAYWRNCISPIVFTSPDTCYYITNVDEGAFLVCRTNDNENIICEIKNNWGTISSFADIKIKCYSGLIFYKGYIYFNDANTIYRYSKEYGIEIYKEINKRLKVYGITLNDDTIWCELSDSFMNKGKILKFNVS